MPVISLKGCVTADEKEFDEFKSSSSSLVYTNAESTKIEPFSIEISVGDSWNENFSNADGNLWEIEKPLKLGANTSVVVQSAEKLKVPHNKYGLFVPTGSMFMRTGLITAAAKVEPSFAGNLIIRLVNTSRKPVTVKRGMKIGSVIFWPTETTSYQPPINFSYTSLKRPETIGRSLKAFWKAHWGTLLMSAFTGFGVLIATLALIVSFWNGEKTSSLIRSLNESEHTERSSTSGEK